jgi:imidazole glycerol phosphate synthase glutamine amidotransferase subunit
MKINIVDIPSSNIFNVQRFVSFLLKCPQISSIDQNSKLTILPGVGAFDCAIEYFEKSSLNIDVLMKQNTLVLGICLGMHVTYLTSQESKKSLPGFSLFSHTVSCLQECSLERALHTGWNFVVFLTDDLSEYSGYYYFSHAYGVRWYESSANIAYYFFNGRKYVAATIHLNYVGLQFHPELSGASGVSLVQNLILSFPPR